MSEQINTPLSASTPEHQPVSAGSSKIHLLLSWVRTIACLGVFLIVLAAAFVYGPTINSTLSQAQQAVTAFHTVTQQVEQADVPGLIQDIELLVQDARFATATATRAMEHTVQTLEELDLAKLNQAIEDFAAVVEPLSRLFGKR